MACRACLKEHCFPNEWRRHPVGSKFFRFQAGRERFGRGGIPIGQCGRFGPERAAAWKAATPSRLAVVGAAEVPFTEGVDAITAIYPGPPYVTGRSRRTDAVSKNSG